MSALSKELAACHTGALTILRWVINFWENSNILYEGLHNFM